jgi:SSS family solute:Na+ symporter
MNNQFLLPDYIVFIAYAVLILSVGLWVSRDKKGHKKSAEDYFLAGKSLPWWAIGASLIAANISAEQFIGMSGSGFAVGLAIASYEWISALTIIIVGKFFLPVFIKQKIYTIPEFVEKRYSTTLKSILAVFWIALFVFVNLTSVLYLGAKALDTIIGTGDGSLMMISIIGLALFAASYSLWGGLAAVAWTDVIQVVLLIIGGFATTIIALNHLTPDGGVIDGIKHIYHTVPDKLSMIIDKGEIITPNGKDAWQDLPGLGVLIGGLWVAALYYWGFNQYIIQRALAAKSLKEAQHGIVFAGFLKLITPLIVVIPGIIAYVLYMQPEGTTILSDAKSAFEVNGIIQNDNAYPWLISKFIPTGLKGLVLAALAAAIVSSLASMLNSTATIFTMDIYVPHINKKATENQKVRTGRLTAAASLVIAGTIAPLLGSLPQAFQFIQEYTGIVSPGILAIFLLGLFCKKANNKGALWGAFLSIPVAMYFKVAPKQWIDSSNPLSSLFIDLPWMHQMGFTFLVTMAIILVISFTTGKGEDDAKRIKITHNTFATDGIFNISAFAIILIFVALYAIFW